MRGRVLTSLLIFVVCVSFCLLAIAQVPAMGSDEDPGEPGTISGTVVSSGNQPVANAKVYVREHGQPQVGAVRYVITDEKGAFRIVNLRPGDYDVFAVHENSSVFLTRSHVHVHLPKSNPSGRVIIRIGAPGHVKV